MSHRSRASRVRQHVHCDSCYSRRCRARVEVSVCCAVGPCRLHCGAVFHLCKEEEHLLLCPNVRVPCLNAVYGCPFQMTRSSRAAHLQVCPASVVCCSMEWNRWPANDAHSYPNTELHENLLRGRKPGGCLDLAMALRDQEMLFHSLKMKKLFPELVQRSSGETEEEQEREKGKEIDSISEMEAAAKHNSGHTWESFSMFTFSNQNSKEDDVEAEPEPELTQEEREAIARGENGVSKELLENYNTWERMFSMEMGGCREATVGVGKGQERAKGKRLGAVMEEGRETADTWSVGASSHAIKMGSGACNEPSSSSSSTIPDYLLRKKFEYLHVEPMKIITVRTFKIPSSFAARQSRIRNPGFYKRESKSVDTSDLGVVPEDVPIWEEVQASLLCCLEKEQRGHLIAESVNTDPLLQDQGTQTYNFLSSPFLTTTSLADLTAQKPLELHLQLQLESVTSRHHKASSAFTFLCGHTFQRREYAKHFKNIHSDIQMCANGWFQQRCPLAYLGCTYSQNQFQPSTHEADITFSEDLGCFGLHPSSSLSKTSTHSSVTNAVVEQEDREDVLSSLPYEVLCYVATFLDSLSLSQLALVSRLMRQVCSSLLQERGMVTLCWERETPSHGGAKWGVTKRVWQFSTLFSPVDSWRFKDVPSMSEHLKTCPFYERVSGTEPILLPCITGDVPAEGRTLVSWFQRNGHDKT